MSWSLVGTHLQKPAPGGRVLDVDLNRYRPEAWYRAPGREALFVGSFDCAAEAMDELERIERNVIRLNKTYGEQE